VTDGLLPPATLLWKAPQRGVLFAGAEGGGRSMVQSAALMSWAPWLYRTLSPQSGAGRRQALAAARRPLFPDVTEVYNDFVAALLEPEL